MPTYEELRAAADAVWAAVEQPPRPLFIVSMNTSSIAAGARETLDALRKLVGGRRGFDVMQTGDAGLRLGRAGRRGAQARTGSTSSTATSPPTTPRRSRRRPRRASRSEHAIGVIAGAATDGVPMLADLDWTKLQVRWLMHNCGVIDPDNIDHYIARGGYSHFMRRGADGPRRADQGRQGLDAARPLRLVLLDGHEVELPAGREGRAEVPGLQRRRGRPRRVGQPRPHGERPAPDHRGHADRRLRDRRDVRLDLHPRRVPARHRAREPRAAGSAATRASSARTRSAPA